MIWSRYLFFFVFPLIISIAWANFILCERKSFMYIFTSEANSCWMGRTLLDECLCKAVYHWMKAQQSFQWTVKGPYLIYTSIFLLLEWLGTYVEVLSKKVKIEEMKFLKILVLIFLKISFLWFWLFILILHNILFSPVYFILRHPLYIMNIGI